jgi:hypothetical protein
MQALSNRIQKPLGFRLPVLLPERLLICINCAFGGLLKNSLQAIIIVRDGKAKLYERGRRPEQMSVWLLRRH